MNLAIQVTKYHDSETDAAVDMETLPPEPYKATRAGKRRAIEGAQARLNDYWQTATVDIGYIERVRIEDDVWRDEFVDIEDGWYVGRTWVDRR